MTIKNIKMFDGAMCLVQPLIDSSLYMASFYMCQNIDMSKIKNEYDHKR